MRHAAVIILLLKNLCTFSQPVHEVITIVSCFDKGGVEVQAEFDNEEILYVDFEREEMVYTVPSFITLDPEGHLGDIALYNNARKGRKSCLAILAFSIAEEKYPPEEKDPPESLIYPAEEVRSGLENTLICFINHFYPPHLEVNWTRNGHPVSEGVSLSRYYPNEDNTFHQFSTLIFTPSEGDIYSCTVEHSALERPMTKFWEPEFVHQSHGWDVFCGVGLMLGLMGVAAGTFLFVKGHHRK